VFYERQVLAAADLDHTPNPGPEYAPLATRPPKADAFREWTEHYAGWCVATKWGRAWQMYAAASQTVFPVTATGVDPPPNDLGYRGRAGAAHTFEFREPPGIDGCGLLDPKGVPRLRAQARIDDPQVEELLGQSPLVELHLKVGGIDGAADLEVRQGRFRV